MISNRVSSQAPSAVDDTWSPPINLSRSGAASGFQAVEDTQGRVHIVWQDTINDFIYTHGNGDRWSDPEEVEVPFGTRQYFPELSPEERTPLFHPLLVADAQNRIHAFWIDDVDTLWHSRTPAANFASFEAWTTRQSLAEGVRAFDVGKDADNTLHLTYIRSLDTGERPAGLYYQRWSPDATELSPLTLLYQSDYFRSVEREAANVHIVASNAGRIFVAWDNRPLHKVFVIRSGSAVASWDPPIEMDSRIATDSPEGPGPADITLSVVGSSILALWEAAHEGLDCSLYYSWSSDGGDSWQQQPRRLEAVQGCPDRSVLVPAAENFTLLMTTVVGTTYLVAWDGNQWSHAAAQDSLSVFLNPETFKQVYLSCLQPIFAADILHVVGCDTEGGQDIWLRARQLGSIADWFSEPPVWTAPQSVAASDAGIEIPHLIADARGALHAFWRESGGLAILHTVWDGARWSRPRPIFSSPAADVGEPAVSAHNAGRLFVAWGDNEMGQIHLIQAGVDQSILAADWSASLDLSQTGAAGPDIIADRGGRIYLSYAVPVNEGRGIYLTTSDDLGESWSETVAIFDGAAAGWPMVGPPRLALTENGQLHVLWTQHTIPGGRGAVALYYAHSSDGGRSWSEPSEIAAAPISWSDVVGAGEQTVHLLWQEVDGSSTLLHHQSSTDGGLTWSLTAAISNAEETGGPVAATADGSGRVHLLRSAASGMEHWMWGGDRWSRAEDLKSDAVLAVDGLSAAVVSDATLALIFTGETASADNSGSQKTLFFASRPLDGAPIAAATPPPVTTGAPASAAPDTVGPTPSAPVTAPATLPAISENDAPPPSRQETALVSGILPAGLTVLLGFVLGLRLVRSGRD